MPYATASETRLYYERHGTGCPVLFLAGVGSDLRCKSNIYTSYLANRFDILALDHRGTGQSDKPDTAYTMEQYAQDAVAVLDAVGWHSAHVIGVSFGGMVAQELAIRNPQRVRSLVLCCTTSGGAGGSSYPIHELSGLTPDERARKMLGIGDTRYNQAWQAKHPQETAQMLANAAADASPFLKQPSGIAGITRQIEARSHHNTYDRLPAISVPTLICGGKHDGQAKPEAVRNLHRQIPGAELHFFEGGHGFLNQDPNAYKLIASTVERNCRVLNK